MASRTTTWTDEMETTLLALAAKYKAGKNIKWAKVIEDPMWKWKKLPDYILRARYSLLKRTTDEQPDTQIPETPIIKFCPNCGLDLLMMNTALLAQHHIRYGGVING